MKKNPFPILFLLLPGFLQALDSQVTNGSWSSPLTWGGSLPGPGTVVNIQAGHTVMVDIPSAQAGTVNVYGTLRFSTITSSTLTLSGGNLLVRSTGRLEMGSEASPVPSGITAVLVLAKGSVAGEYGLEVEGGGDFVVQGASKSPYALAAAGVAAGDTAVTVPDAQAQGWSVGDLIVLGKTNRNNNTAESEERVVVSTMSSGGFTTLGWNGAAVYSHASTSPLVVANLTRNVVVRSSGTTVSDPGDSAYLIGDLQAGSTIRWVNAEFSFIGESSYPHEGIFLSGTGSSSFVSSCTFRNGWIGLYFFQGSGHQVQDSIFYKNLNGGLAIDDNFVPGSGGHALHGNVVLANETAGFGLTETLNTLVEGNYFLGNLYTGLRLNAAEGTRVIANHVFSNGSIHGVRNEGPRNVFTGNLIHANNSSGVNCASDGNLFVGNEFYGNGAEGVFLTGADNFFVKNRFYENRQVELEVGAGLGNSMTDDAFGYDFTGARPGDANYRALSLPAGADASLVLKNVRFHATEVPGTTGFSWPGNFLLSYNQDADTGTVRLTGDMTLAGQTLTLDHASDLYGPAATAARVMKGGGLTPVVTALAGAIPQFVTLTYSGSVWTASGSVSGLMALPSPQFSFSVLGSPVIGDRIDFALTAASGDANRQKRLYLVSVAGGRSRLTAAPSGGLSLRGVPGTPAVLDLIGSNFGSVVSSGTFMAENALIQNLDADGVQLSGSAGVSIASSTFDNAGFSAADNAYITARDLASSATFYNVFFGNGRSPGAGQTLSSVRVLGGDQNLSWAFDAWPSGGRGGPAYEADPNHRVRWLDMTRPGTPGSFTASPAGFGAVHLSWTAPGNDGSAGHFSGGWRVFYSTDAAQTNAAAANQAQPLADVSVPVGTPVSYDIASLPLYTTYYFKLWAVDDTPNISLLPTSVEGALPPQVGPLAALAAPSVSAGFIPRDASFIAGFDKAVLAASAMSAFRLRRVRDNRGNAVDQPMPVLSSGNGASYTFSPQASLAGNSVYEVALASGVVDANGAPSTTTITRLFTTLMDRTEENVWAEGAARVTFPAAALTDDGYMTSAGVSLSAAAVAAATAKLLGGADDAFRRPVDGTLLDFTVNDAFGAPQSGRFSTPVAIDLLYPDATDDGLVDGTSPPVRAKTLAVHWLDEDHGLWVRLPSQVDLSSHRVSALAEHFTTFALIGRADGDTAEAYAFPVPYRGTPGGIFFTNLPQQGTVKVYTVTGEMVREMSIPDGTGQFAWDVKTQDGQPAAPGVYFYEVKSGSNRKSGRLAVIR
jgi:hypothetical protein